MAKQVTRKKHILSFLQKQSALLIDKHNAIGKFNATWISSQLGFSRDNVSRDLNQLYREKQLIKIHGKPVLFLSSQFLESYSQMSLSNYTFKNISDFQTFFSSISHLSKLAKPITPISNANSSSKTNKQSPININESPFKKLIGYNRSLKTAVKQSKAAILYPPHGLHTLIIGPTGGGKTTFARIMYSYAQQMHCLSLNAPYIIFNCADYAGNQQLLLSHLFGHKKGAFTGAINDHTGLIEKANHGILFLDEVHRLPPEGQEMLFSLIDRGQYYRLGDSNNTCSAQVLIIAATTEKPGTAILKTFLRRIPNLIQIPDLENRSLEERYDLIKLFFQKESQNMEREICVSAEILKLLLIYDCPGNIGQLENDIKLICANAFVSLITEKNSQLYIKLSQLPAQYLKLFDVLPTKRSNLNSSFDLNIIKDIIFYPKQPVYTPATETPQTNFYKTMLNNSKKYFAEGLSLSTINSIFDNQITEYFDIDINKTHSLNTATEEAAFLKIISPQIYYLLKKVLLLIEQEFDLHISTQVFHGLVLHVETMLERIRINKPLRLPKNNIDINKNNIYYLISTRITTSLEQNLNISIPKQESALISLCLQTLDINTKDTHIAILVLTHGYHTATDFAQVANRLLGTQHAHGFCMTLEEKVSHALKKVTKIIETIDEGKGVLILADMGSLTTFGELITNATNIKTYTLKMATTSMVIEATRKALSSTISLEQLAHEVSSQSYYIGMNVTSPLPILAPIAEKLNLNSEKIIKLLKNILIFIDTQKAIPLLEKIFANITTQLNCRQTSSLYIKFMFHTSCMLERAIRNDQMEYQDLQTLLPHHIKIFNIIKKAFTIIEHTYGVTIQDSELCYITEIFSIK
ncbi:sigma 54-interacting transcriptional regulator [Pectinatus sottacetonis]|uniref:sigma 54-interacting transcriptional regulator n=1 Tax=Pectinatus sottacetonis TaxID=1002795 RepID=UPI0018C799CA|nr:sigma-54-dependent transcriptional regulator [Pectinatus sottacetonis]